MIYFKCLIGDYIIELFYDYILNIKLFIFVVYLCYGYILYVWGMCVDFFY